MTIGEGPLVDLRLDGLALHAGCLLQAGHVDLIVEVADVADDGLMLHLGHVIDLDHVVAASGSDEDVGGIDDIFQARDLVAVHGGLQCADRVDFGDDDARTLATQGIGRSLTHIAVSAHHGDLAADERVGCAVDAVNKRVPAAVLVVELALGNRIVHVDRREEQRALTHHLVQAVHTSRGFLGDTLDALADVRPALRILLQ